VWVRLLLDERENRLILENDYNIIKSIKPRSIGNYWERGNQNEIDIVAVDEIDKKLLLCEVKLSSKRLNRDELVRKSVNIIEKYRGYEVEYRLLSVEDIDGFV